MNLKGHVLKEQLMCPFFSCLHEYVFRKLKMMMRRESSFYDSMKILSGFIIAWFRIIILMELL